MEQQKRAGKQQREENVVDLFVYHQKDGRGSYLRLRQLMQMLEATNLSSSSGFDKVEVHCTDFPDLLKLRPSNRSSFLYRKWTVYQQKVNLESHVRPMIFLSLLDEPLEVAKLQVHFNKKKPQFDLVLGLDSMASVPPCVLPSASTEKMSDFSKLLDRLRGVLVGEQKLESMVGETSVPKKTILPKPQDRPPRPPSKEQLIEAHEKQLILQAEQQKKKQQEEEAAKQKAQLMAPAGDVVKQKKRVVVGRAPADEPKPDNLSPCVSAEAASPSSSFKRVAPSKPSSAKVDEKTTSFRAIKAEEPIPAIKAEPFLGGKTNSAESRAEFTDAKPAASLPSAEQQQRIALNNKPALANRRDKRKEQQPAVPAPQEERPEEMTAVPQIKEAAVDEFWQSKLEKKVKELEETVNRQMAIEKAMDRELKKVVELQSQYRKLCGTRAVQEVEIFTSPKSYFSLLTDYCTLTGKSEKDVLEKPKEEFRYFCWRYLPQMRLFPLPELARHAKGGNEAVLVEFRVLPHVEFLLRNAMLKLGSSWSMTVVCGLANQQYMHDMCSQMSARIRVHVIDYENVTPSAYSLLLASHEFWNMLEGEKILIFQEDTMIFGKHVEEYLRWDYIGAPWPKDQNDTPNGVGNGGLSLRSKSAMLRVLDKMGIFETDYNSSTLQYIANSKSTVPPEDVYFSKNLQTYGLGKVAPRELARGFSSETDYNPHSWGAHGVWVERCAVVGQWKSRLLEENLIQVSATSDRSSFYHRGGWRTVLQRLEQADLLSGTAKFKFLDVLDEHFLWGTNSVIEKPWCGCVHGIVSPAPYAEFSSISKLFKNKNFLKSLQNCKFLFALASNVQGFVREQLDQHGFNHITVAKMLHPVDSDNVIPFAWSHYVNNNQKKLIQIGQQARKITSIQLVESPNHAKLWLTGTKDFIKLDDFLQKEVETLDAATLQQTKEEIAQGICKLRTFVETYEEYDELLSKNIVFLDLYDSAACNVLLECILRNTPIVLNRTAGVQEYLPPDYPLYFDSLDDVPSLLVSPKIQAAHRYLCNMDKSPFTMERFVADFARLCYQELLNK